LKHNTFAILIAALLVASLVCACSAMGGQSPPAQAPAGQGPAAAPTSARQSGKIVADASVVPARALALSSASGGVVASLPVAEGDQVAAGQVLLQLDNARQRAALAQAEAGLQAAEARLAGAKAAARAPELAAAEASVAAAQAALDQVKKGADESQLIAAEAALANAEAARKQAQGAYDRVKSSPEIGLRPEALQLEQATNAYNAAKAQLDVLRAQPDAAALAAAQAEVRRAQAQLDLLKLGASAETIAAAEADVQARKADVALAQTALDETELRAPFAASVCSVLVSAGEYAPPGVALLRLADLSAWLVETDDVTELDVGRIRVGDAVTLTFDGISGLELPGKVLRIESIGQIKQGDITYTVVVQPERSDERLRWNMTATVVFPAR